MKYTKEMKEYQAKSPKFEGFAHNGMQERPDNIIRNGVVLNIGHLSDSMKAAYKNCLYR